MTSSSSQAPPQGGAFYSTLDWVLSSLNALGSIWIFLLMVLINIDAFGRTLFANPVYGVNEMIELSLVGIVFLQLGDATRRGRLTRSDGFFKFILARVPRLGRFLGATFDLLGVLFMAIIIYGSIPLLHESWVRDYYVGEEGIFTFPVWPVKTVIVIGCFVTLLQFAGFAWRYLRPANGGPVEPEASPEAQL